MPQKVMHLYRSRFAASNDRREVCYFSEPPLDGNPFGRGSANIVKPMVDTARDQGYEIWTPQKPVVLGEVGVVYPLHPNDKKILGI